MGAPTGDRTFRDMVVRIAELTVNTTTLEKLQFSNCRIVGPAVLVPLGNTEIVHSTFDSDLRAIYWEIPPERDYVVGAVGVIDCVFSACRFDTIGWAGPRSLYDALVSGTNSSE